MLTAFWTKKKKKLARHLLRGHEHEPEKISYMSVQLGKRRQATNFEKVALAQC
jgi:hypothetical protein